jgi:hypothetical protein
VRRRTTQLACQSQLDKQLVAHAVASSVQPGVYYLFYDATAFYGDVQAPCPGPYRVQVKLRPVLLPGRACDPAGVENRCANGACPTSGSAVCA